MSIGLGLGIAAIAFLQIALCMGVAYYLVGIWVEGKPRAYIAALLALAYVAGRVQQAAQETGWAVMNDPKVQIVLATYLLAFFLFAFRTKDKSSQV
jgi:hypothetical protein